MEDVGILIVFFLSLKYRLRGVTKLDIAALSAATIGLFLWFSIKEAATALYIVLTINTNAILLTINKTNKNPIKGRGLYIQTKKSFAALPEDK